MASPLNPHWLTQDWIDFEYKKYVLLAYLSEVKENFDRVQLYPFMSDLVFHYQNLVKFREHKSLLKENFPKELSQADFERLRLRYETMVDDDGLMQELEAIVAFAIPQFKELIESGKDIYEYVAEHIEINPVGISPLRLEEGYFFLRKAKKSEVQVYEYRMTVFEQASEMYRGLQTQYLETATLSWMQGVEHLKRDLIRRRQQLPNPATYQIYAKVSVPLEATFLPVAKRMLIQHLTKAAA
jgi:hypothetical protein